METRSQEQLLRFGAKNAISWKTVMPKGQFQNVVSEAMVKIVKGVMKAFLQSMGKTKLSLNELNTCLLEVANIVNECPIGLRPN
jgi:hypothetical protein